MHYNADLIVLDEPTAALAVAEVRKVLDFVRRIKSSGRACIYIEHNLAHVHEVADRLVILDRGAIVAQIRPKDMSVIELTEYLISCSTRREAAMAGSQASVPFQRFEGLPIILVFALLLALFMYTAPQVFLQPFIYTTFLSTLPPLDTSCGRAHLRDRGRRDRSLLSRRHLLFGVRLRGAFQGV